jgi:hypothetical protein
MGSSIRENFTGVCLRNISRRKRILPRGAPSEAKCSSKVNRNKKSVALSFKHPDSLAILNKIIETSDVVVENYIPGTLKKYGLDYQALSVRKPDLIYASITGTYIERVLIQDTVKRDHMLYERATMSWLKRRWD